MNTKLSALAFLSILLMGCQRYVWKEFISSEGAFSVQLPADGAPTEEINTVNTPDGPIAVHLFVLTQKKAVYMTAYSDYPAVSLQKTTVDERLDGARDGAVANIQGRLLSELIISLNEYPGRELKIEPPGGKTTLIARIFIVNQRLYQVAVLIPKEKAFAKNVTTFLDSFKLLEK